MKYLKLQSGGNMPIVGYGTWHISKQVKQDDDPDVDDVDNILEKALNEALECGYRHIDTATVYRNEHVIGKVLKEWISSGKVTRDELFIVTKLPTYAHRSEHVENALKKSLEDLQLDYVDLYLVHVPFGMFPEKDKLNESELQFDYNTNHITTWEMMEKQVECGRTKAIGVSNYNIGQIQRILDNCQIKPESLQVEHHIYLQQPELVKFCKNNGICVIAHSCLGSKNNRKTMNISWSNKKLPEMMENDVVTSIAKKHDKTPSQILLRYIIQNETTVIPSSTNPERMALNIDLFDFDLDVEDMESLKDQDAGEGGRFVRFNFLPNVQEHPEYPFPKEY